MMASPTRAPARRIGVPPVLASRRRDVCAPWTREETTMSNLTSILDFDHIGSAYLVLLSFVVLAALGGLLVWIGLVGRVVALASLLVQTTIAVGFRTWVRCLSWAPWPVFVALVAAILSLDLLEARQLPPLSIPTGLILLFLGITTCLAYMYIDVERYEVARGYKALHNPLKGQKLATNLVRYGSRVGVPMLASASAATIVGFAMLNQGLYETVGRAWYQVPNPEDIGYADFLVYTLMNLLGVVDLLHIASSYHILPAEVIHQKAWPASTLLTLFKSFFTVILLQQVFASVRRGRLLTETIGDFWSPHAPIHERARVSLPQHGPGVVRPLLMSVRAIDILTAEQRVYLARILADVGPSAIPILTRALRDPHSEVRGVAVSALGQLHAIDVIGRLVALADDADDWVRQCLAEALGRIGSAQGRTRRRRVVCRTIRRSWLGWWLNFLPGGSRQPVAHENPIPLAIATLRAALNDPTVAVRTAAATSLGQLGTVAEEAAPDLLKLLSDADENVRCQAAEALALVKGPLEPTLAALSVLLTEASARLRCAAASALGQLGKEAAPAVTALVPLLEDAEESVRTAAAEAISKIGTLPEEALQSLSQGLKSSDNTVRAHTAAALGEIGSAAAEATPALAEALTDENDRVRAKAAKALGQLGEGAAEAVPVLVKALRDPDNWVSALAAEALGEIGDSATHAVPALIRALRHANPRVRANAAGALGKMGPLATAALPALDIATRDADDDVRIQALSALGDIRGNDPHLRAAVRAALQDANPKVRAAATEVVGRCADLHDEVPALLATFEGANDEVKVSLARALGRIGATTVGVLDCLGQMLSESSAPVQSQAAQSLGQLGREAAPAGEALSRLSQGGEAEVRDQALRAMARIQPPQAISAFLAGLHDPRPETRKLASAGLILADELPPEVIKALIEALHDPEIPVCANAARVLARLPELPAEAIEPLLEAAGNADDKIRLNAALALQRAPLAQARPAFRRLLTDTNPRMRLLAAGSLLDDEASAADAAEILARAITDPALPIRRAAEEWIHAHHAGNEHLTRALQKRMEAETDPETIGLLYEAMEEMTQAAPTSA
jgi:HEAT repeat protein